MSSNIQRGGKYVRPSFNFLDGDSFKHGAISAQLLESIRNVLESVDQRLETLQNRYNCSETLAIPRTLRKIEANTRRKKRVRKVTP